MQLRASSRVIKGRAIEDNVIQHGKRLIFIRVDLLVLMYLLQSAVMETTIDFNNDIIASITA